MSSGRIKDDRTPADRGWEEFYRNRWQYDKVVRSTHGVNCTGGCSWMVHVKDGIVGWELQANDYPQFDGGIPNHEPRGCQRGISFSWYLYSPLRVKYPYMRGALIDLWREARQRFPDPVDAWRSIVENPESRKAYTGKRGMGGFRRAILGRGDRADRRLHHLHGEEIRTRSGHRLHPDSRHVDDQLRRRDPVPSALRRGVHELLRLVLRPSPRFAAGLGRADRRQRVGRLVQRLLHRSLRLQRPDDPHPGCPLSHRGPLPGGQGRGHVPRLLPGDQVRRQLAADRAGA